jgi:phosphonoacetaldehyde hydrolase
MKTSPSIVPAVVLDWAGTTVDHGCLAPVAALRRVLARHGLEISNADARRGMGLPKKEHLRELLASRGAGAATDQLYPELESALFEELVPHATLISGTLEFVHWLRERGVRIGTTTGYTSAMMRIVAAAAARQGYNPDLIITPDLVAAGRPSPDMMIAVAERLGVGPLGALVKIGDTPADVAEGRAAGSWTIGVALTGNALGLSLADLEALSPADRIRLRAGACDTLRAAGADYVVDSIADCVPVLLEIFGRLRDGDRPRAASRA